MIFKTDGERIFYRYLTECQRAYKKDVPVGQKEIDFLVEGPGGSVYCEIADLGETDEHLGMLKSMYLGLLQQAHLFRSDFNRRVQEELRKLEDVTPGPLATSFDPAVNIQKKLEKKTKQIEPLAGKFPVALVIFNPGFRPDDSDLLLRQCIGNNRFFTDKRFTAFSAIAILEEVTDSTASTVRLRVYTNPHAQCKFPDGFFNGPADLVTSGGALWEQPIEPISGAVTLG